MSELARWLSIFGILLFILNMVWFVRCGFKKTSRKRPLIGLIISLVFLLAGFMIRKIYL